MTSDRDTEQPAQEQPVRESSLRQRRATPEDAEQINALYNRVFSFSRSLHAYRWEFLQGPYGPAYQQLLEDDRGHIVAHFSLLPNHMLVPGGRVLKAGKVENSMIAREWRGQKRFRPFEEQAIAEAFDRDFQLAWITHTLAAPAHLKAGFYHVGRLLSMYRPLRGGMPALRFYATRAVQRLPGAGLRRHARSLLARLGRQPGVGDVPLKLRRPGNRELETFLQTWNRQQQDRQQIVTLYRDPSYMKWRFLDNPHIDFAMQLICDAGDRPFGLLVWHQRGSDVVIDDLLLLEEWLTGRVLGALLSVFAHECLRRTDALLLSFLCLEGSRWHRLFSEQGFVPMLTRRRGDATRSLLIRPHPELDAALVEKLKEPHRWMLTHLFTEGIR